MFDIEVYIKNKNFVKQNRMETAMKSHGVKEVGIEARAINDGSYVGRRE